MTTFPPEYDVQAEFTTTWTTTNSDGSVETESGIVSQSGSSFTTLTTFPPESDVQAEFTTTWTTTNSDGSVATESGIVSQSGSSLLLLPLSHNWLLLNSPPLGPPPTVTALLPLSLALSANLGHHLPP